MHTLCQILPQLAWRPYLRRAERWQLAALALRALRQALATCYACGQSQAAACALGTALLRALAHEGALAGYLLPALPPTAGARLQGSSLEEVNLSFIRYQRPRGWEGCNASMHNARKGGGGLQPDCLQKLMRDFNAPCCSA